MRLFEPVRYEGLRPWRRVFQESHDARHQPQTCRDHICLGTEVKCAYIPRRLVTHARAEPYQAQQGKYAGAQHFVRREAPQPPGYHGEGATP